MLSEAVVSYIALVLTYVPPSRVFLDKPFNHNDLPHMVLSRSERITYPHLVIWPLIDRIAFPLNTNGLQNVDYTLLGAIISFDDSKGTCTSLNDVMMRCYRSRYKERIKACVNLRTERLAKRQGVILKEVENLRQEVCSKDDERIAKLQQFAVGYSFKVSALRENHKKLHEEKFNVRFLTKYPR
ncbi:hypothetical protein C1H46_026404 [Malus baccata]|uniref:Uncharacterized protein n=1 Tax=Malus baccata TaxID=106549 RepID=A0A540LNH6_MALBA|nr:hypothetical protein C1H46_026404 [Malus baccata]